VYDPPLIEVAYALDPRDPTAVAVSTSSQAHTWHAVAMASQKRSLYEISNEGATVKKTEQDSFVDAIRTTASLQRGVHRFRVRIDETAGILFVVHSVSSWLIYVYHVYTYTYNSGRGHTILSNVNFFHVFGYCALQAKISAITWALWRVMATEARHSIRPTRAALKSTLAGSHLMVVRARAFRVDQSRGTC